MRKKKRKLTTNNIIDKIKNSKSLASIVKSINMYDDLKIFIINHTSFLNDDATINERLHCIKGDIKELNLCTSCNKNKKIFDTKHNRYRNWCEISQCKKDYMRKNRDPVKEKKRREKISKAHKSFTDEKKQEIVKKIKNTMIEKYGTDSYAKTQEFKDHMLETYGYISPFELKKTHDKSKETLLKKYGVNHNFKISGIQNKIERTFMENYGYKRPAMNDAIKQKIIETNNELYGGNSPMHNNEIQKKALKTHLTNFEYYGLSNPETLKKYKETMFERYGYENVLQNEELFNKITKSSYKYKQYILPSGKTIMIQGYEDYVLDDLLKTYNENDIITSVKEINKYIGPIYYYDKNIKRRYYPDIYIKSENKIIEVKSDYTYDKDLLKNKSKQNRCIELGFDFDFIIVDKKKYKEWKSKQ